MCTLDSRFNVLVDALRRYFQDKISLEELNLEVSKIDNVLEFLCQEGRNWESVLPGYGVKFEAHLDYSQFQYNGNGVEKITLQFTFSDSSFSDSISMPIVV